MGSDTATAGFGCSGAADSAAIVWAASARVLRTRGLETASLGYVWRQRAGRRMREFDPVG